MKRVILDIAVTLDGLIQGPNGELDWLSFDEEMAEFTNSDLLAEVDAIFYGRKAYEVFGRPSSDTGSSKAERKFRELVEGMNKYVFSKTIDAVGPNTKLVNGEFTDEVREIKKGGGKDIWLCGGSKIIGSFLNAGFVDEIRLSIHPTILGAGLPLFKDVVEPIELGFLEKRVLQNGVIAVRYQPR